MVDENTHKYPDTPRGAIDALAALSVHNMTDAVARPDPQVDGVWLVTHKAGKSIVYLAGYKEPLGKIRATNDFEDIDC